LVIIAYWIWIIWFVLLLYDVSHYTLHPAFLHYSKTSKTVFEKNAGIFLWFPILYALDSRLSLKRCGFHLSSAFNLQDGFRRLLYLDKRKRVICVADIYMHTCICISAASQPMAPCVAKGCANMIPNLKINFSLYNSMAL